ncbi:alpha carbonic anhydrase [Amylocarpus encephaloides]|uniref:Alpha carbonic anhydrase n=1 Tax=Amylocarpus encephaloides TaxID=45428 RepID=A0A9P7YN20_9HELO|nr:alpha carbonic anhydrase [Amylocarpus encephaloides]
MYRLLLALSVIGATVACPDHNYAVHSKYLGRRAEPGVKDWDYDASYNWGSINPNYTLCQTGTQQAPIHLQSTDGFSTAHVPTFHYDTPLSGNLLNWNYGPAFTVDTSNMSLTSSASFTFDDETVYLKGWHIHSPADHSVDGQKSRSELHLVHGDATGHESAVLAILMDPGIEDSAFAAQFATTINGTAPDSTKVPNFDSASSLPMSGMDVRLAVKEADNFSEFWTYNGSLTSPPCTEGIRFFVAKKVMTVGMTQMQEILRVSTFSARDEQKVWMHGVNV